MTFESTNEKPSSWLKVKCLAWLSQVPGDTPEFFLDVYRGFFPKGKNDED